MEAVTRLVARIEALGVEVSGAREAKDAPKRPSGGKRGVNAKLASVWASYTPKQRAARIAAMRAGHAKRKRKLAEKAAAKPARRLAKRVVPSKPAPAARKSAWVSLSPEQRAERIARMKAGRKGVSVQTPAVT